MRQDNMNNGEWPRYNVCIHVGAKFGVVATGVTVSVRQKEQAVLRVTQFSSPVITFPMPVTTSKTSHIPEAADPASEPRPRDLAFPKKLRSACNACNEVKLRCTGTQPCSRCKSRNMECVYSYAARTGKPKGSKNKKTLERLRLRELELEKQAEGEGRLGRADSRLCEGSGRRQPESGQNIFSDSEDENGDSGAVGEVVMASCPQAHQPSSICLPDETHSTVIVGTPSLYHTVRYLTDSMQDSCWNSTHLPTASNDGRDFGTSGERFTGPGSASIGHASIKSPAPTIPDKTSQIAETKTDTATGLSPTVFTQSLHNETDSETQVTSGFGAHTYDPFTETFNFDETMYESLLTPSLSSGNVRRNMLRTSTR